MKRSILALGLAGTLPLAAWFVACGSNDAGSADGSGGAQGAGAAGPGGGGASGGHGGSQTLDDGGIAPTQTCASKGGTAPVAMPQLVRNLAAGETGWFSSPVVIDLDGDGKKEIVAPLYSTFVFGADGAQLAKGTATKGRVYAPSVVADLDGDGVLEIVVGGNAGTVAAYNYQSGKLVVKAGWPASASSGGQDPEIRGMAGGDLDGDGKIEIVVTTTNTSKTGAQVFVFAADGKVFQPAGTSFAAWPRYNGVKGPGGDADFNGAGNQGYGCYGLNVGIGNLDDDPKLEIVTTYDNHQINVFHHDGTSMLASSYYSNPTNANLGKRLGWGQFIRWLDPAVEEIHYHQHADPWPDVKTTQWLQWTASPPNVVDMDGDGKNEVVGIPNAEMHEPYETQNYAFMVLRGGHGDGEQAARRMPGFETLPVTDKPAPRPDGDYYPPDGVPAPATANIVGDARPEIVASINDGFVYAISPDGQRLWRFDYAKGKPKTFASEVAIADLNGDGTPEIVFGTYSLEPNGGRLIILANTGALLYDIPLPGQGMDGNGIGVPAAPTIADVDGDGVLEIVLTTFDHGIDVFTVPGSADNCVVWATGRGGYLRAGSAPPKK